MKKKKIFLFFLIVVSGFFYYNLATLNNNQVITANVIRVIDGDTVELESLEKVRLKGINTPEKSQEFSLEATNFLKSKVLGKEVELEISGIDKYGRILGYLSKDGKSIQEEILEEGLATLYYYEKDNHYENLQRSEESAKRNNKGIWKKSKNSDCVKLISLTYKESPKRCTNTEELVLENSCDEDLVVIIKDEATHIYEETLPSNSLFKKKFSCIWNDAGDTLYVSDTSGMILHYTY